MKYSIEQIANYIGHNMNIQANSTYIIWYDRITQGLKHTVGSWEYRNERHEKVMGFITMDEVPSDMYELVNSVQYQLEQQDVISPYIDL